ncbi:MAG: geranylgeranyl reductase family protein [Ginsengibacter sp.]
MTIEKIKTGICIVGAGPSGSTLSLLLAKKGIDHLIVDAAEFPRDKICGDGIDLNVVRVLNQIDVNIALNEFTNTTNFTPSQGMRFILPYGKYVVLRRKEKDRLNGSALKPIFYLSKRKYFDNLLVEKLDPNFADVRLGTKIEKIEKTGERWILYGTNAKGKVEIETRLLIGADGDHSVVLRHVGERKIDRRNYAAAVRQYWKGINGLHDDNLIEIYFPRKQPLSYFWIFPLPGGEANVGYGMASSYVAKKNIDVRKVFEELIKTDPYLAERFKNAQPAETIKGWGLPMSGSQRKAHGNGWMLVGDAASLICPTSGEGIGSGMISAYIAAQFIERAVKQNCFEERMFKNYDREIHKRMTFEEKVFRIINYIPGWLFTMSVNSVLSNRILQKFISKKMDGWIDTAYKKTISVKMN